MAFHDVALAQGLLDRRLEVEQSKRVGNGGSSPADTGCDLVLCQTEVFGELSICVSLLYGVEVGSLEVLDERDGQLVSFRHLANDCRNVVQACHLRGAYSSLTSHQLIAIEDFGDENGLKNTVDGYAARQ
jgi:hypothetical protein